MFVKKFIDKISKKPAAPVVVSTGLGPEDVNAHLVFHYGIPPSSTTVAYDPINKIIAISSIDGRIKLFGRNNTQRLLESDFPLPSKFLQFFGNRGLLLNVTTENHIQVWKLADCELVRTHIHQSEITAFTVVQETPLMYIGDNVGNISVLKIEESAACNLLPSISCKIPFPKSHGMRARAAGDTVVKFMLPQPNSENKRILIIFEDGIINLWGIEEKKSLCVIGGTTSQAIPVDLRKVSASCWVCSSGTKVAVGYTTGDILIWTIPNKITDQTKSHSTQNMPLSKLNIGYKAVKVPIVSLTWVSAEGKENRLYVNGVSDLGHSSHLCQVILLNENMESRTIKFVFPLSEACCDIKVISGFGEQKKNTNKFVLLLLKSGELWLYNDSEIEKYLLQCRSNQPLWVPKHVHVKTPLGTSTTITVAIFVTLKYDSSCSRDEEDSTFLSRKKEHCIFSDSSRENMVLNSKQFLGFSKIKKLYITGHQDGSINFWDASCPLLITILSIKYQSKDGHSLSENPVTAMYFDINSHVLVAGYQNGLVNVFVFQKSDTAFSFLQAKQGCSYTTNSIKLNGVITSISMNSTSSRLAVGTNKGFVSVVEIGMNVLYTKCFPSDTHQGITSMQFEQVFLKGSENNTLLIAAKDTTIYALDESTGLAMTNTPICANNPSQCLFMQTLEIQDGMHLLLICSEKSIRLYFLVDAIQGIKKLYIKKRISPACCWASTFCSPLSGYGLILVFTCGKIQIRSIPDLVLLNETSMRIYDGVLCSSSDGELIVAKGDQEIIFISVLRQSNAYRLLDPISRVYDATAHRPQRSPSLMISYDENNMLDKNRQSKDSEEFMLDIDDIDLEDSKEKSKVGNFALLNKNIGKKFTAVKGKLKKKYPKRSDVNKSEPEDENKAAGTINEIKKRYGYPLNNEHEVPRQAEAKLHDNIEKLEGINQGAEKLQNSAKTFSTMAKQLLRSAEDGKGKQYLF